MLIIVQIKMFSSRTEKVENKEYFGNKAVGWGRGAWQLTR